MHTHTHTPKSSSLIPAYHPRIHVLACPRRATVAGSWALRAYTWSAAGRIPTARLPPSAEVRRARYSGRERDRAAATVSPVKIYRIGQRGRREHHKQSLKPQATRAHKLESVQKHNSPLQPVLVDCMSLLNHLYSCRERQPVALDGADSSVDIATPNVLKVDINALKCRDTPAIRTTHNLHSSFGRHRSGIHPTFEICTRSRFHQLFMA